MITVTPTRTRRGQTELLVSRIARGRIQWSGFQEWRHHTDIVSIMAHNKHVLMMSHERGIVGSASPEITLADYESLIRSFTPCQNGFIRIHRSVIINRLYYEPVKRNNKLGKSEWYAVPRSITQRRYNEYKIGRRREQEVLCDGEWTGEFC